MRSTRTWSTTVNRPSRFPIWSVAKGLTGRDYQLGGLQIIPEKSDVRFDEPVKVLFLSDHVARLALRLD